MDGVAPRISFRAWKAAPASPGMLCFPVQSWTETEYDPLQIPSKKRLKIPYQMPSLPLGYPQPILGVGVGGATLHTSKSSGLQLLIPDDSGGDPQLLSNLANFLEVFMEKNNMRHVKKS